MAEDTQNSPLGPPVAVKKQARKKNRPTYSCLNCHKRKVKCDRVKPCGACCLRGAPCECEYGGSKQDHHYIEQSSLIENLMQTCDTLQRQLEDTRRQANLPMIKQEDGNSPPSPHGSMSSLDRSGSGSSEEEEPAVDHAGSQEEKKGNKERLSGIQKAKLGSILSRTASMASVTGSLAELTFEDQSSQSLQREKKSLANPTTARALVELFVERLISEFSPTTTVNVGSTMRLRQAAEMRVFSPMLCNAFEAASLTFAGSRECIPQLRIAGNARYVRLLQQLQNAICHLEKSQSTDVLLVVLMSTIIESFRNNSTGSILKHQLGGLQLLQSRTPYRHRYGLERSLFVDLRHYWVTAALAQRQPSFLAAREWLTVPWMGEAIPKDILQRILDIAVDVPAYLAQVDAFSTMLETATTASSSELVSLQSSIWETATELDTRLRLWEIVCAQDYAGGTGPQESLDPIPLEDFPVFKCRDPNTLETFTPRDLIYPDLLLATSMCFYWAMRLMISATDSGLPSVLSSQDRYESACNICRTMKYYVQNIPGTLVVRMIFALQTAYDSFAEGTVEKQFVVDLFLYIGKRFNFPVFATRFSPPNDP